MKALTLGLDLRKHCMSCGELIEEEEECGFSDNPLCLDCFIRQEKVIDRSLRGLDPLNQHRVLEV